MSVVDEMGNRVGVIVIDDSPTFVVLVSDPPGHYGAVRVFTAAHARRLAQQLMEAAEEAERNEERERSESDRS